MSGRRRRLIAARVERRKLWDNRTNQLKQVKERIQRLVEREARGEHIPREMIFAALSDREFPIDKGDLNGACNRSACLERPATWFNTSTLKHYCRVCGIKINQYAPASDPVCFAVTEEPSE